MVAILMMSAKLATLGLLKKIKVFCKKVYVIISVNDVTNVAQTILYMWSCDQSLITLTFLYIITSYFMRICPFPVWQKA